MKNDYQEIMTKEINVSRFYSILASSLIFIFN